MHPRILERRQRLAAGPGALLRAQGAFESLRRIVLQGQRQLPAPFWKAHIQAVEILCAELNRIDPEEPMALARIQIFSDAAQCLQERIIRDIDAARSCV